MFYSLYGLRVRYGLIVFFVKGFCYKVEKYELERRVIRDFF